MERYLIFNADDFGASTGVTRGIIESHCRGVVTSTSLMVTGRAAREAVALSREHPQLAVGLHWDVCGEDEREFDLRDPNAVRTEFYRQLTAFQDMTGRMPTHIDSHRHVHSGDTVLPLFCEMAAPLGIPVRGDARVKYLSGFYAQWEWKVTELRYISLSFLQEMIRNEVLPGFSEFGCHPGYVTPDYAAVYLAERETEVATLTNPAVEETLRQEGIHLISFADVTRLAGNDRGR